MRSSTACVASTGDAAPLRYSASSSVAVHWVRSVVTPSSWQGRHPVLSFRFGPIGPVPKDRSWLQSDGTWTSTPGARHAPAVGDRPPRPVPRGRHRRAGRRPAAHRRLRASAVRRRRHPVRRDDGRGWRSCSRASSTARCAPPTSSGSRSWASTSTSASTASRALMLVLVAGIGVLVVAYAARYFARPTPHTGRLLGLLVLFGGAMAGLVVADNLLVLYGFWELTSVTSFLLIGHDHEDPEGPGRRPAGPAGHRRRRAGDARRLHRPRPGRRHVPAQRHPRRPARAATR